LAPYSRDKPSFRGLATSVSVFIASILPGAERAQAGHDDANRMCLLAVAAGTMKEVRRGM
jgi:hypothetical protein